MNNEFYHFIKKYIGRCIVWVWVGTMSDRHLQRRLIDWIHFNMWWIVLNILLCKLDASNFSTFLPGILISWKFYFDRNDPYVISGYMLVVIFICSSSLPSTSYICCFYISSFISFSKYLCFLLSECRRVSLFKYHRCGLVCIFFFHLFYLGSNF